MEKTRVQNITESASNGRDGLIERAYQLADILNWQEDIKGLSKDSTEAIERVVGLMEREVERIDCKYKPEN